MANKKKLLVKTPQTEDGANLLYDEETSKPVIKETILELSAKKHFESLNATLPKHLRHTLTEVEVDEKGKRVIAQPTAESKTAAKTETGDKKAKAESKTAAAGENSTDNGDAK